MTAIPDNVSDIQAVIDLPLKEINHRIQMEESSYGTGSSGEISIDSLEKSFILLDGSNGKISSGSDLNEFDFPLIDTDYTQSIASIELNKLSPILERCNENGKFFSNKSRHLKSIALK